jgi:4-hydroxybenzoate polyprenyltransferase
MSAPELLVAYLRQRIRVRAFVPLALLLAIASWWLVPSAAFQSATFFESATQAFVLILAFRVWDDLEDRNADRARHPERVMALSGRTAPFIALVASLIVVGVMWLLQSPEPLLRVVAIAIAACGLSIWYATRRLEKWNRVAGGHIVLAKYPLIAYAVAPTLPPASMLARTVLILGGLYVLICIYEYVDDPELRHILFSRRSLP